MEIPTDCYKTKRRLIIFLVKGSQISQSGRNVDGRKERKKEERQQPT